MALEQAGPRVMVVDDTPANLKLLDGMLGKRGYRTVAFPRGELALRAAAASPPDLILLDIMMPGMDGFEVCARLKADESLRDIPVIFISALTDTVDKVKAFSAGGVDYVTKPFQFEEVEARVATHLRLRRLQLQLEQQNRELQESNDRTRRLEALRDDLTHMIVHDLRSPLTAMQITLETLLMAQAGSLGEPVTVRVQRVLASTKTLIEMVSSVLDVSRMEAGEMPLDPEQCDLVTIAREALDGAAALKGNRHLHFGEPDGPATLTCDRGLILRVFQNLLANALKFTPDGGTIEIRVAANAESLRVVVEDNGPGMPPECHERVFEKFGQVEARAKRQAYSTGLGLAFCKLAIEAHGGRIGVDSEVGKGSAFWFVLPPSPGGKSARC